MSSCVFYEDPHASGPSATGCQCSGYTSLLPKTTIHGKLCGYSQWVTATAPTTPNGYPFTKTMSNSAIIAYATTTVYVAGGDWYGAGPSTVLQAGTALKLEMDRTSSVNVGTVSDSGNSLFVSFLSAGLKSGDQRD